MRKPSIASIKTLESLIQHQLLPKEITSSELAQLKKVATQFSIGISAQMHAPISQTESSESSKQEHSSIAKQFVPSIEECHISPVERADPIGDQAYTKTKGIIHRHPDRCLLMATHVCAVYCRFCFRREKIGSAGENLSPKDLEAALSYIENHPEIWEVIITGGDPLILKPSQLRSLLSRLRAIQHVEVIRIHTRIPVVQSERINADMIAALKDHAKPLYVVLHANHPKELTQEAEKACAHLIDAGIPMLSQTVLLKGINDTIEVLSTLMRGFIKNRIKPYYLHQGDLTKGTQHFRTSISKGQQLMKELRGRFSGICQPTYVLDIPGGYGKVPIGPQYLYQNNDDSFCYCVLDYQGKSHEYPLCHDR